VENINPWRVRACVAAPGGMKGVLDGGKIRWLAVYDKAPSNVEKSFTVTVNSRFTTTTHCQTIVFPLVSLKIKYTIHRNFNSRE